MPLWHTQNFRGQERNCETQPANSPWTELAISSLVPSLSRIGNTFTYLHYIMLRTIEFQIFFVQIWFWQHNILIDDDRRASCLINKESHCQPFLQYFTHCAAFRQQTSLPPHVLTFLLCFLTGWLFVNYFQHCLKMMMACLVRVCVTVHSQPLSLYLSLSFYLSLSLSFLVSSCLLITP